jgi:hypothetical protein
MHPFRLRQERGDEHPGVQEAALVRVILDSDEIEAFLFGQADDAACIRERRRTRIDVRSEGDGHRRAQR